MKLISIASEPMTTLQLIPDKTLRNYQVESLSKAMTEFYDRPLSRLSFNKSVTYQHPDRFIFRTVLKKDMVSYYLLVPARLTDHFKQKAQAVWEHATIKKADNLPVLDPAKCKSCELTYRRHDIFALNTNKDENAPLPGILATVRDMQEGDMSVIDVILQPADRVMWEYDAGRAYERFQAGKMPRRVQFTMKAVLNAGFGVLNSSICEVQSMVVSGIGNKKAEVIQVIDPEREALAIRGLSKATTTKIHEPVLKTSIRIACQCKTLSKAKLTMKALAGAFKDITADNELIYREKSSVRVLQDMEGYRISTTSIKVSAAEAGKLMQLPTAGLQDEFPQVQSIKQREVSLPDELFLESVPGVVFGDVTEKGVTKTAKMPVVEIPGVKLKHVYDALCTPTLGTGQMGTGKTEGFGGNWAMGFLQNGFTVFLIDTADGQQAKNLEDALPPDFPDNKIIHIELDNTNYPIALNWSDTASRRLDGGDNDLEALMMGERLTSRLIDYLDGTNQAALTERMRQYLTSAARAVLRDPNKSLLDIELALRSPIYREELLADKSIQEQPEIVQDLMSLQARAENGTDSSIIDPILARLKMFSESTILQNLFHQPSKIKNGKPLLDFRYFADNPNGGYGYLVAIHASSDTWGEDGQELVLSFVQDKLLMAIYSRVDIPQDKRKPCLNLIDEPHRFIKKAARLYKNASVELRKYRMKLLWLAHYLSQMGAAATAVTAGGCQFTSYKTQELKQFMELGHAFQPYEPVELYKTLPEKWEAVNKIRLPSGKDCPAFIAKMAPPPEKIQSREKRRQDCAKQFGRHWKEVNQHIQQKRLKYQQLDEQWRQDRAEEKKKDKKK